MRTGDGYGEMLLAALDESGGEMLEIVERDDGFIVASRFGPGFYFAPFRKWPSRQRRALRLARGRVLDVGAGAGRVALHLEQKGSRGCRARLLAWCGRGVPAARRPGRLVLRLEEVDGSLGRFDTVVMYGNNLGLLASRAKGHRLLRRLHEITGQRGRILGGSSIRTLIL
jgi:hypothetical protein